ncbi:hypothetical protein RMCBS344292_19188 [Rhizopus microsporus]|nr:hypothetical protein RMCBS344292_19188 [Rhizopus microsporus]
MLEIIPELHCVLSGSSYNKIIFDEDFVELDDDWAKFLNEDWAVKPQMRFACSVLLSGMILVKETQCIIVHCNEVYARTKSLDSHRESFKIKKGMLPISSLPPQNSEYQNVHVACMNDQDGVKLVIGTKAFNGLITSSLRLDSVVKPDIGPSTTHFTVYPSSSAKNTRIFLSRKSLEEAKRLARDTKAIRIRSYDILSQLRQVRTHFDSLSTYLCCRASSPQTDDMSCRPIQCSPLRIMIMVVLIPMVE